MNSLTRNILQLAVVFFCISSIWVLGNKNIIEESNIIHFNYIKPTYSGNNEEFRSEFYSALLKFIDRIFNIYGLPFAIVAILMINYWVSKYLLIDLILSMLNLMFGCCSIFGRRFTKFKIKDDFYSKVDSAEMRDEIELIET